MNAAETINELETKRAALLTEYGVTLSDLDSLTDEQFDQICAINGEINEAVQSIAHTGIRVDEPRRRCTKCGHLVTAAGRCDDCDDWDD